MNDWVNWSEYSSAVTPESQRLAEEREKLREQQRQEMVTASEKLRGEQAMDIRTGGKGEVSSLPGYSDILKQQQAGQGQWATQQARGWETMLAGQPKEPQQSGWSGLSKRLTDIQERGQVAIAQREMDAQAKAEKERKQGVARMEAQRKEAERQQNMQRYTQWLADNYGWGYADRFAKFPRETQDQHLYAFLSGSARNDGIRAPRWSGSSANLPSASKDFGE